MLVDNTNTTMYNNIQMSGHYLDMNNNDIYGVDQIFHEGDTNTYMQFHASDQWRVVTGGSERLEVNNSAVTSQEPIYAPSFHGSGAGLTGVGGISTSTSTYSPSFSHTGANSLLAASTGTVLATTTPASNVVWATHTVGSGVGLVNASFDTASSGITTYVTTYYGVTVGILHWNGSILRLKSIGRKESSISGVSMPAWIQNMSDETGVFFVAPGDKVYGVIMCTYHPGAASLTGGAAWSAGKVTMAVSEIS
jgi:hypothetical protein